MMATATARPLDRLGDYFRNRQTRAGVLARRLLRMDVPGDDELVEHLLRERRRQTRMDGSMDGSLVRTAWVAWEVLQLNCPPDHSAVVRTVGYLLGRQDHPGRHWGEGCTPERHERHECEHFMGGFFAAATADRAVAPIRFPSGVEIQGDAEARFAASCFALRSVLRAGEDRRPSTRQHLVSLLDYAELWAGWTPEPGPDLAFFALGALGHAPLDLRDRVHVALSQVLSHQGADGGWPGAAPFHATDMLLSVPSAEAREAVKRCGAHLASLVVAGELSNAEEDEERALIALRALVQADG